MLEGGWGRSRGRHDFIVPVLRREGTDAWDLLASQSSPLGELQASERFLSVEKKVESTYRTSKVVLLSPNTCAHVCRHVHT